MRITMYGAEICPDCVEAKKQLSADQGIELDYRNIIESTKILKEFLAYRDHESVFKQIKEEGKIGIPFFVLEDGTKTFELEGYISKEACEVKEAYNACSIDGKGQC